MQKEIKQELNKTSSTHNPRVRISRTPAKSFRDMNIAQGSSEESRYYLILAEDLCYGRMTEGMKLIEEVSRLLESYIQSMRSS